MARRYVYDESRPAGSRFVEIPIDWRPTPRPRVHIGNSTQEPLMSMANGKYYTCARKMERDQQAMGYEVATDADRQYFDRPEHKPLDYTEAAKRACEDLGVD